MLKLLITGNLRAAMETEIRSVSGAMRRATQTAGKEVQARLRAQARTQRWRDSGRAVANAWRLKTYPPPGVAPRTLRPAALIYSNMREVVEAFEEGATITHKGGRYLCWPTGYNAPAGRRGRGKARVSPDQMKAARKQAFVIRSKSNPKVLLWCLRVRQAQSRSRTGRVNTMLFVARNTQVGTANRKGKAALVKQIAERGFVPMFFLMKQVRLPKTLDVATVRNDAASLLARAAAAEFARLPPVLSEAPR